MRLSNLFIRHNNVSALFICRVFNSWTFLVFGIALIFNLSLAKAQVNASANQQTQKQVDSVKIVVIGGVEQSGYSSLGQNTSPFVNAFVQGPQSGPTFLPYTAWGRIRLLGSPAPSTQGIVSVFTDPTGQLSTQDYTKVGTSIDFSAGLAFPIPNKSPRNNIDIIIGAGATTPLSSQSVAVTYKAPAAGTVECTTLVSRFSVNNGYTPGLSLAATGSTTCLSGGYTDIAFSNQDRSSFLRKWGAGIRASGHGSCAGCLYSSLDLTLGQDEAITRGILRHFVLKLDGVYPLPSINDSTTLYIFGSAYLRTWRNQDLSPLILQTETGTVTIPSATVIVLPLEQPDRDFYRLGIGLDIKNLFTKKPKSS